MPHHRRQDHIKERPGNGSERENAVALAKRGQGLAQSLELSWTRYGVFGLSNAGGDLQKIDLNDIGVQRKSGRALNYCVWEPFAKVRQRDAKAISAGGPGRFRPYEIDHFVATERPKRPGQSGENGSIRAKRNLLLS